MVQTVVMEEATSKVEVLSSVTIDNLILGTKDPLAVWAACQVIITESIIGGQRRQSTRLADKQRHATSTFKVWNFDKSGTLISLELQ
jgi:hypothetical protein